jgi:glycosyltransferase involved in cell wall biosynthesis
MNQPLVSVIVPIYNGERHLGAALESVFAQDYHPFEVIVVDDGSEDGSAAVARSFPAVRYLRQANQGPAAARNAGTAAARGEFIAFHDADDLMAPNKLSAQVDYLLAHPAVGCVLTRYEAFFEDGIDQADWLKRYPAPEAGRVHPMSGLVRRSALAQVGGFDPAYRVAEGMDLLFRMGAAGVEVTVLPQILMRYRVHHLGSVPAIQRGLLRSLKVQIDRKHASRVR